MYPHSLRASHQSSSAYSFSQTVVFPALSEPRLVVSVIFSEKKDGQFRLAPDYSCLRITQQYDAINPVFSALGRGQQQRRLPGRTLRDYPFRWPSSVAGRSRRSGKNSRKYQHSAFSEKSKAFGEDGHDEKGMDH